MKDDLLLPDELDFHNDHNHDEKVFLESVYEIFYKDFIINPFCFQGKLIVLDLKIADDNRHEIFWHLITKDNELSSKRNINISRAQKISWIKALLILVPHPSIKHWKYLEGKGEIRHYIWAESANYVVILEEKTSKLYLVSAFCVESWKKGDLNKKFKKRILD